jgi:hypothetical protein
LAVTFNPGDNFRVVASAKAQELQGLNDTTSVPTTGNVQAVGHGAASPQLSVWRWFRVEQDVMKNQDSQTGGSLGGFQKGHVTAAQLPVNDEVVLTTDVTIATANEYLGGALRVGGINYPIVRHDAKANATVTVTSRNPIAANNADFIIYQDDFDATAPSNDVPKLHADVSKDAELYSKLQESTKVVSNPYAEAYLQPKYGDLNQFKSQVSGATFTNDESRYFGPFKGANETQFFWVVYLSTAFEYTATRDLDPDSENPSVAGVTSLDQQIAAVFLETTRDFAVQHQWDVSRTVARIAVHELAHEFGLSVLGPGVEGGHRNYKADRQTPYPNIMSVIPEVHLATLSEAQFRFAPEDIVELRQRVLSPGTIQ